jgi:hypothetical protein
MNRRGESREGKKEADAVGKAALAKTGGLDSLAWLS